MERYDVILVGGGVMGCAAAYALAQRRASTLLIDACGIGNHRGSSHGRSRIIRLAYGRSDYIALCRAAYGAWRALEAESGDPLLHVTGGLDFGSPEVATWRNARTAMQAAGVAYEVIDVGEIRRRYPQFRLDEAMLALYQSDAAVLHADRCLTALVDGARRRGAVIAEGECVQAIRVQPGGITVTTQVRAYGADRLILAGGAGMTNLLAMIGGALPLTVSVEQVGYFRTCEIAPFLPGKFPLFIMHRPDGRLASGFPLIRDPGIKLMIERKQASEIPSMEREIAPDPHQMELLRQHALTLLPGLTGELAGASTCLYTMTPDEDFVLDRFPQDPRIVIASACSGHGFKFGALFGDAMADLAMDGTPAVNLDPFRMTRFDGIRAGRSGSFAQATNKPGDRSQHIEHWKP